MNQHHRLILQKLKCCLKLSKKLKRDKIAVIFITHRLDEVFATCDTVTILKDGKLVHRCKIEETNKLGYGIKDDRKKRQWCNGTNKSLICQNRSPKEIFLEGQRNEKFPKVIEQSIKIRKGEVLGALQDFWELDVRNWQGLHFLVQIHAKRGQLK